MTMIITNKTANDIRVHWADGFPIVETADYRQPVKVLLGDGDGNTKLRKNRKRGFRTVGLSLSPHKQAGIGNVCSAASAGCIRACLDDTGLGRLFRNIKNARRAKTILYYRERQWFIDKLGAELSRAQARADKQGADLAARLNVFSDVAWEKTSIIGSFPRIEFYDYSKHLARGGALARNYWVTVSRSETNENECLQALARGINVAMVFDTGRVGNQVSKTRAGDLPKTYKGFQVIDGDETDLRFTDTRGRKRGRIVGLRLKASSHADRAAALASGFVIPQA